ncbi:MAG TPA: methionine adenosyltransferase [Tissierellia bacterium]|nr:methionine adenosyltransferase [Tissierellia bacterium]
MRHFFTSESVTEGHPDKVCDAISDAILDAIYEKDPQARVACECLVTTGLVLVAGEITTDTYVDIPRIARETVKEIGYTRAKYGFDGDTCGVIVTLDEQSSDIALGVDQSQEAKEGDEDGHGAGDQGMMFGYASDETPELMPLPIMLAHKLAKRLADVRKDGTLEYLRPDGKTQVTLEYEGDTPVRIDTIVVSAQHHEAITREELQEDIRRYVIEPVLEGQLVDDRTEVLINPTGRFVMGGPQADTGLTGRKLIVDTYGGMARQGGGALSGKDPTKVDRSAAYAARYVAKNLVAAGLAKRVEIGLSYAIGVAKPTSVYVDTFGTGSLDNEQLEAIVLDHFDLTPSGIIKMLDLRRPIYRQTAAYGHFGRTDIDLSWEKTDRVDELKQAAEKLK